MVEACDGSGDERGDGGGEAGQPQAAPPKSRDLTELLLGLVQAGEYRLGVRHQGTASVGEPHRSHATLDEPGARLALEGGDLLADRRLGERQRLSCGGERAEGGDLSEDTEPAGIKHK